MAVTLRELKKWLRELEEDCDDTMLIGIDDGGLALEVVETGDYYEIGGMPEDGDDD